MMWGQPPSAVRRTKSGCSFNEFIRATSQLNAGTNPLVPAFFLCHPERSCRARSARQCSRRVPTLATNAHTPR